MLISNIHSNTDPFVNSRVIKRCIAWLEENLLNFTKSRVNLDGDKLFVMYQEYVTIAEDDGKFESHQQYIDLQCVIEGTERIDVIGDRVLNPATQWKDDFRFYLTPEEGYTSIYLGPLDFCVLFPGEAHRPKLKVEQPVSVKKYVFKIDKALMDA
ncbi:MAG: YhcH/YjgK/YiaL family protein [Verrucomicrobiota bacterium]